MTLEELEAEAMKLELPQRTELVRRLAASVEPAGQTPAPPTSPPTPTDEERERLWLRDAMQRSRELRERQLQTEPPDSHGVFRPRSPRPTARPKPRPPARKTPSARRPKPRPKPPARARSQRAAARPKPVKARVKARGKPRSRRR